jgi:hypothetical protein
MQDLRSEVPVLGPMAIVTRQQASLSRRASSAMNAGGVNEPTPFAEARIELFVRPSLQSCQWRRVRSIGRDAPITNPPSSDGQRLQQARSTKEVGGRGSSGEIERLGEQRVGAAPSLVIVDVRQDHDLVGGALVLYCLETRANASG